MTTKYKPIESKEHEGWYVPEGYEYFVVNDKGELKNAKTGYVTKGSLDDRGYLRVCIWDNDKEKKKDIKAHRVICTAFHGPCPSDDHEVGHKDDDRSNNAPDNLHWVTRKKNMDKVFKQESCAKQFLNW